jgi:cation transport regulator
MAVVLYKKLNPGLNTTKWTSKNRSKDMPYTNTAQLPKGVQQHLSQAAQEIYRDAYNEAWDSCRYAKDRFDTNDSRQVTANRVAWETVKNRCERDMFGRWVLPETETELAETNREEEA